MKNNHITQHTYSVPDNREYVYGLVSVIGPCYNERDNLEPFIHSLETVLKNEKYDYEILLINDGSTDGTAEKLEELRRENSRLRVIHLVRNFGQQGAMLAGIAEAKGSVLVTMDVDLQHPAETISEMIRHWEQGIDVVYALPARQARGKSSAQTAQLSMFKSSTSKVYQFLIAWLQESGHTYISTDFRLFDREVADVICDLPEKDLYLRNVFAWLCPPSTRSNGYSSVGGWNFQSTCIPYRLRRRQYGDTKYTTAQLVRLAIHGVTNGGIRPLRLSKLAGAVAVVLSVLMMVIQLLYHIITWTAWAGWEVLLLSGLIFGNIQLILLYLIAEYIGKVFLQNQGRPSYIRRKSMLETKRKGATKCKDQIRYYSE